MARNLLIGDIHAMYDRMLSALSSSGFDPEVDNLYAVGDFCDRGPEPVRVLDYLMSLPHFFPVVGNHDMWLYEYLCGHGPAPSGWIRETAEKPHMTYSKIWTQPRKHKSGNGMARFRSCVLSATT